MQLPELLGVLSNSQSLSDIPDLEVKGVTCDSRAVLPGFVFVAIPGALTDGHLYIESALDKGAIAIVLERPAQIPGLVQVRVPQSRQALAELSRAFYDYPDRDLYMIGVTATNGKTTTTSMLRHILTSKDVMTSVIGSVSYSFGDEKKQSVLTTPESSDLHAMLARQKESGVQVVSMEVSSIAESQCRVYGIEYDAVAFLNITPDHMPDHGSFEAYYEAKASLVRNVKEGTPVILNRDEPLVDALRDETPGQVITMGLESVDTDVGAENLSMPGGIPRFDFVIRRPLKTRRGEAAPGRYPVQLAVPGRHTVYNAMTALVLAITYGIAPEDAVAAISSFPGVERRLQIIYQKDFTMIDDHVSDEDNTRKMLEALEVMTEGRPVKIIYAVRGNRGVLVNREVIGQFAEFRKRINWARFIVTDSLDVARPRDVVHKEEHDAVITDLENAGYDISYEPNLTDAISKLLPQIEEGEFFVLAGSHNMDKGARIALNFLADMKPEEERASILKILDGRMMG